MEKEIKTFLIRQEFKTENGVEVYGGTIYARSFEEAYKLASKIGATVDGVCK